MDKYTRSRIETIEREKERERVRTTTNHSLYICSGKKRRKRKESVRKRGSERATEQTREKNQSTCSLPVCESARILQKNE
jgi:hypothetical protein